MGVRFKSNEDNSEESDESYYFHFSESMEQSQRESYLFPRGILEKGRSSTFVAALALTTIESVRLEKIEEKSIDLRSNYDKFDNPGMNS